MKGQKKLQAIRSLENHASFFESIAPAGYTIALNIYNLHPQVFYTTKPKAWTDVYKRKRYFLADPVMQFILTQQGTRRWSETGSYPVPLLTPRFLQAAASHGLRYGVVFVRMANAEDRVKNMLSVSRSDREYTDEEIDDIELRFEDILSDQNFDKDLTERQITLLWLLANGAKRSEAAQQLCVSEETVKKDLEAIRKQWNAANSTEAVGIAISRGIITPYNDIRW